ncbi:hypothetical protein G9A89_015496 [Geosiphon pyriformis]|nr:hypothetical protein G9A89_015496 [Geosiphon pyriformis]
MFRLRKWKFNSSKVVRNTQKTNSIQYPMILNELHFLKEIYHFFLELYQYGRNDKLVKTRLLQYISSYKKSPETIFYLLYLNPNSQSNFQPLLAYFYHFGIGTKKDFNKAFKLYHQQATQNDTFSQLQLAYLYEKGIGTKKSATLAFEWYQKAAENGNVEATFIIANFYYWGKGVKKDRNQSFGWFVIAAELGHPDAKFAIAQLYCDSVKLGECF